MPPKENIRFEHNLLLHGIVGKKISTGHCEATVSHEILNRPVSLSITHKLSLQLEADLNVGKA